MPPRLIALTEGARQALGTAELVIERFPFKVGRESRTASADSSKSVERRSDRVPPLNDVYLVEPADTSVRHVSREHFLLVAESGKYFLVDRGSACGTIVNGKTVGGDRRGGLPELPDQAEITVGKAASPFVFTFRID